MKRGLFLTFLVFYFVFSLSGQSSDHSKNELEIIRSIINKPKLPITHYLNQMDQVLIKDKFKSDTAAAVFKEVIQIAAKKLTPLKLAWIKYYYAELLMNQHKKDEALLYYKSSIELFEENKEQRGISRCKLGIGEILLTRGNYTEAATIINQIYKKGQNSHDTLLIIVSLKHRGFISGMQEDLDRTLDYYQEGLHLAQKIGWFNEEIDIMRSIGNTYYEQKKISKALAIFYTADSILNKRMPSNHLLRAILLTEIGLIEVESLHKIELGLSKYTEALPKFDSLNNYIWSSYLRAKMAEAYFALGKTGKAMKFAQEGYKLSIDYGLLKERMNNLEILYKIAKAQNLYKEALTYYTEMTKVQDSMVTRESIDLMVSNELKFAHEKQMLADSMEFERRESVLIAEQEKKDFRQRTIRNFIAMGFAGTFIFLVIVYRQRNRISIARKRSDDLLLNILPEEVAQELKEKGSSEAQLIEHVTVLFTDFKGFTRMSEQLTPKELVKELNTCFSEFDQIIDKFGVEKIKTIGDSYMAAGGLPTPNTTHVTDVLQAAFAMLDLIEAGKHKMIAEGRPFFEIRIGIHTGPVVAGIVGVKKFQYDIWGDTVNTASRMESSGEVGRVNVSQATYDLLKENENFSFISRGKIEAKGKGEIEMYFVKQEN
jgi:adenylate cyclase